MFVIGSIRVGVVQVLVRVRPPNAKEQSHGRNGRGERINCWAVVIIDLFILGLNCVILAKKSDTPAVQAV